MVSRDHSSSAPSAAEFTSRPTASFGDIATSWLLIGLSSTSRMPGCHVLPGPACARQAPPPVWDWRRPQGYAPGRSCRLDKSTSLARVLEPLLPRPLPVSPPPPAPQPRLTEGPAGCSAQGALRFLGSSHGRRFRSHRGPAGPHPAAPPGTDRTRSAAVLGPVRPCPTLLSDDPRAEGPTWPWTPARHATP